MKHKFYFITITIYSLMIFAFITRNGDILLMVVPLLIYLLVGIFLAPTEINLTAARQVEKGTDHRGTSVLVKVNLKNESTRLSNVLICDKPFSQAKLPHGQYEQWLAIQEKEEIATSYAFHAQRCHFVWESIHIIASDPFCLVEVQKEIPAPAEIFVEPEFEKLSHIYLRPKNTLHSTGLVPARCGGSGLNFWAIREYQLGDSLRWLNWKTIARHPLHLYTTEFEHEEIMEIGLILDARLQTAPDFNGDLLFEHSISAAMSLAELFLREGNRVGLLVFGQSMTPVPPGYGKRQLHRISTTLASATVNSNFSLAYLEYVQKRLFSSRALIVMVSSLGLRDLDTYKNLKALGYQILLVSPDPVSFIENQLCPDPILGLALRATQIERYAQLKQLLQIGVKVIDWQVQRSLNETLRSAFSGRTIGDFYV